MPVADIPFYLVDRNRANRAGLIYYIGSTEAQRVKIGFTQGCPFKRLKTLQIGSPYELILLSAHPGELADEQALHEKFNLYSAHGEWFNLSREVCQHIFITIVDEVYRYMEAGEYPPIWLMHRYSFVDEMVGD